MPPKRIANWIVPFAFAICGIWPSLAFANNDLDIVCPCTVEFSNLSSVSVRFGIRNLQPNDESGPLRATITTRGVNQDLSWYVAQLAIPPVPANTTRPVKKYIAAFRLPPDLGMQEFTLRLKSPNSYSVYESITWVEEPIELGTGGQAFSSLYFEGTPTIEIEEESATVMLPILTNQSDGQTVSGITVELYAHASRKTSGGRRLGTYDLGRGLEPGNHLNARTINIPISTVESREYVSLSVVSDDRRRLIKEIVAAPEGKELPTREFTTRDADLLVDSDKDGIGDVNERLVGTDPADAESTPGDSTIDVMGLYYPSFAELYDGDATTRIRHVLSLASSIYQDSNTGVKLRLVGTVEIEEGALDREGFAELSERHGADVAVLFRPHNPGSRVCGAAPLGGFHGNGAMSYSQAPTAIVFGNCGASTAAHEIGHMFGLGHSIVQDGSGTYRWARGHGVDTSFITVMSYSSEYGNAPRIDLFSDPDLDCNEQPCGVDMDEVKGADSVAALIATRFQIERIGESKPDTDDDGFVDSVDALPNDPDDHLDYDGDGIGNKTDEDDDDDGVADASDLFPLDSRDWEDSDGDGVGDNTDAFPQEPTEWVDTDGDGVGDNGDAYPGDPLETVDTDHDGVGNNADAFPFDTREWLDTDGDGVGDNSDEDSDNDGITNTHDVFPLDADRSDATSYRIQLGGGVSERLSLSSAGDVDGDGRDDFLIGAVNYDRDQRQWSSAAYLIAAADLETADAADGAVDRVVEVDRIVSQPGSWKFIGERGEDKVGYSIAVAGDVSGDGLPELLIGVPGENGPNSQWERGAAYLVSPSGLSAADAADDSMDGIVELANIPSQANSWKFIGEGAHARAGNSVGSLGDINGDNLPDLVIGAPGYPRREDMYSGKAYLISGQGLKEVDIADGDEDGVIDLAQIASQTGSWELAGELAGDQVGATAPSTYVDENGAGRLIVHAPSPTGNSVRKTGAVYLIALSELSAADAADGETDGVVGLGQAGLQPGSWQLIGSDGNRAQHGATIGDHDGDGIVDVIVRVYNYTYFVSGADLSPADESDGTRDGVIFLAEMEAPNSWSSNIDYESASNGGIASGRIDGDELDDLILHGWERRGNRDTPTVLLTGKALVNYEGTGRVQLEEFLGDAGAWELQLFPERVATIAIAGDVDSDGKDDMLLGGSGWIYLINSADLDALDSADESKNGIIDLGQTTGDDDQDDIANITDPDDDNDGFLDFEDRFPRDASEWADFDGDGVGDNTDAFPEDWNGRFDTDGDGIADRWDSDADGDGIDDIDDEYPLDTDNDAIDNQMDLDDDNDGIEDSEDAFPLDSEESSDFDSDGVGDNADTDDDNDGVADSNDALPFNAAESEDKDGDGVGDNADVFPEDPEESLDSDGDGQGNNADADDDNDGTLDASDVFPLDATETADTDEDGVGDNGDAFPADRTEWIDTDSDGVGNNADTDDDDDDYTDGADYYPLDPNRQRLFLFRVWGEHAGSWTGRSVGDAGDADSDGLAEVLIGSPGIPHRRWLTLDRDSHGTVHIASGADLVSADLSDGARDGRIEIGQIVQQPKSWAVRGQKSQDHLGHDVTSAGDLNGDGKPDWIIGASSRNTSTAAAYVLSSSGVSGGSASDDEGGKTGVAEVLGVAGSWELTGEGKGNDNDAGAKVALVGDTDRDGKPEFLIGAPYYAEDDSDDTDVPGAAYLVSSAHLTNENATDSGSRIEIKTLREASGAWKFLGEADGDRAGASVSAAGDIDGDGRADLAIGAYGHNASRNGDGAVYLIAAADLEAADNADGETDRTILLENVQAQPSSWKLVGETWDELNGYAMTSGDVDGDGRVEMIFVSPTPGQGTGAIYVLPTNQLAAVDAADGLSDGIIDLREVASQPNAWKLLGEGYHGQKQIDIGFDGPNVATGDLDYDGIDELIIGVPQETSGSVPCGTFEFTNPSGATYVVSGADLSSADAADGDVDGEILLANVAAQERSWKLVGAPMDYLGSSVTVLGDIDGDGTNDLAFGASSQHGLDENCRYAYGRGYAVIASGAELARVDHEDGNADGVIHFSQVADWYQAVDFDLDGTEDDLDTDDDNDGFADTGDAFPKDPAESLDSDYDGIGNNADGDDDNDGAADSVDPFPYDPYETADSDKDGVGDNADSDDDNDGVADADDAFPLDPSEWQDEDGDGIGDNVDPFIDNPNADTDGDGIANGTDTDDDNDGVLDTEDLFPLNANKSDLFFYKLSGETRSLGGNDFDGDGKEDLVVKSVSTQNQVYLVSAADIADVDDDDGDSDRMVDFDQASSLGNSWKFTGVPGTIDLAPAGDVDFDSKHDVVVAGSQDTFVVPMASMLAADSADNESDRSITVSRSLEGSTVGAWRLTASELERGVYSLADINGDGHKELLIGAPLTAASTIPPFDPFSGFLPIDIKIPQSGSSTAYIASGADWAAADNLDGSSDGVINLDQWITRANTFKLTAQSGETSGAIIADAGDFDGDGCDDLIVSVPGTTVSAVLETQSVYLLSGTKLNSFDAADGTTDGIINLGQALGEGFWQLTGGNFDPERVLGTAGDIDGDGMSDLIVAASDGVILIAAGDMAAADAADGTSDRVLQVANAVTQPGSYKFAVSVSESSGFRVTGVGDIDRDSKDDILVTRSGSSEAHLITARDFGALTATNGVVNVTSISSLPNSWVLTFEGSDTLFDGTAFSGDLDGDDRPEVVIGVYAANDATAKAAYAISTAELAVADTLDDAQDRSIALDSVSERWTSD